jgi:hypothetical protein
VKKWPLLAERGDAVAASMEATAGASGVVFAGCAEKDNRRD